MQDTQYMSEEEKRQEAETMSKVGLEYLQPVGRMVRKIRESRGMSKEQLANAIGRDCSEADVAGYEDGTVSMEMTTFLFVSEALGVTPNDLVVDCWKDSHALPADYFRLTNGNRQRIDDVIAAFLDQQNHQALG